MRQPNLLILGAQKAGSTWLYHNLSRHPQVFLSRQKELEFFSRRSAMEPGAFDKYLDMHFADAAGEPVVGEATPSYFWTVDPASRWCVVPREVNPDIPQTVRNILGTDIRFIVSLRSPVERAVSAFYHHVRRGRFSQGDRIMDKARFAGIVDIGFYARHIRAWTAVFPIDQFHFVLFDEIKERPQPTLDSVTAFLGIDEVAVDRRPRNRGLALTAGTDGICVETSESNKQLLDGGAPMVLYDEISQLVEIFSDDIRQTESLIHKKLDQWHRPFAALGTATS